jgi:hypothetical protein
VTDGVYDENEAARFSIRKRALPARADGQDSMRIRDKGAAGRERVDAKVALATAAVVLPLKIPASRSREGGRLLADGTAGLACTVATLLLEKYLAGRGQGRCDRHNLARRGWRWWDRGDGRNDRWRGKVAAGYCSTPSAGG